MEQTPKTIKEASSLMLAKNDVKVEGLKENIAGQERKHNSNKYIKNGHVGN